MTLIRELITIPDKIYQGDFVLDLSRGVHQQSTLEDYVVTPQLQKQFENALGFVSSAMETGQSKAAFVHGSFGSGKSHFMAVLYMLLRGEPRAWVHPDLAPVAVKFPQLRDRRFLLLDFHMIDAVSMESAVLGGYVKKIRDLHPEAPLPAVYKTDHLLADAAHLVEEVGVPAFLGRLNSESAGQDEGWGDMTEGTWTESRLRAALAADPGDGDRHDLVSLLTRTYFRSYVEQQSNLTEAFLSFEDGLLCLSRHAAGLDYQGVVLFLDELVLWLASRAADLKFVQGEIQKIVKLIESGNSNRPVPIISLVARQRDLHELMGESASGLEWFNFQDAVKHWQGRFHLIELEDSNLPEIVSRRVLRPRSDSARAELEEAFDRLRMSPEVRETLQTSHYDFEAFRKLYPFSPALIDVLVAVSSMLQRQRTAIRILMEILVEGRDSLELGQLIPVGDLYDFVSRKFEPYSPAMRADFETAQRLLQERFLPLLRETHGVPPDGELTPAVHNDLRLIKTLILSALVRSVEALRSLDARKLAALNHGTIKTHVPGTEAREVLSRLQRWQTQVGELKVDEETKRVTLNLASVDVERILEQVRTEDSYGNRKRKIRQMLFDELGLKESGQLTPEFSLLWRGTSRNFEVQYLNVREKALSELRADPYRPRLILDYPLDEENFYPRDDLNRLEEFRSTLNEDTRTTVWLPRFLSRRTLAQLGRFIQIEHVLTGERFLEYTQHLSSNDRPQARDLLNNQRNALRESVRQALEMAYGVRKPEPGTLDESDKHQLREEEMLQSLHSAFLPRVPAAASLKAAMEDLMAQELAAHYPAHPEFPVDKEITTGHVRQVWKELQRAVADPHHRIEIADKPLRERLAQIAGPLRIGTMGETHFVLKPDWLSRLQQSYHREGEPHPLTVRHLHRWMDLPEPMGLPNRLRNLLVFLYTEETQRSLMRQGTPVLEFDPELDPDIQLREQELPTPEEWEEALRRLQVLEPDRGPLQRTVANLTVLDKEFRERLAPLRSALLELPSQLAELAEVLGEPTESLKRLVTARIGRVWAELADAKLAPLERSRAVANLPAGDTPAMLTAHFKSAQANQRALKQGYKAPLKTVLSLVKNGHASGEELLSPLREALRHDEQCRPLAPPLEHFIKHAPDWVERNLPKPEPPPPPPSREWEVLDEGSLRQMTVAQARERLQTLLSLLDGDQESRVDLTWSVARKR